MIKISCCLIGITLHVNENELTLIQRLTAVWWKLPAVRLQLPVWLFARNVLIKTPGGSDEMKAYLKLPSVCNFTVKYSLSGCSKLPRCNTDSGWLLFCIVKANVQQQAVRSANAFFPVMLCMFKATISVLRAPSSAAHSAVLTWGFRIQQFLWFSRIYQYICESGCHQEECSCLVFATKLRMHRETAPLHHSYCTQGYIISPLHQAVWWSHTLGALLISCRQHCFPLADTIWCLFHSKFRDAGSFKLQLCCRKQTLMWLPGSASRV